MNNPFVYGKIAIGDHFCNRQELQKLMQLIQSEKSVYLVGRHKMGKTSLINNLMFENHYIVNIDFKQAKTKHDILPLMVKSILASEQANTPNPDFTKLFNKFKDFKPTMSLDQLGQMHFKIDPASELSLESIFALVEGIGNKKPVLFLDNMQHLFDLNKELSLQIFKQAKEFTSIVCESIDLFNEKLNFDQLASKMTFIEVSPLDEKKYYKFVSEHLKAKKLVLSEELFAEILQKTGELTSERQLFFKTLFDKYSDLTLTSAHVQEVFVQIVEQYSEIYEMLLGDLTDNQKNVLVRLALEPEVKVYSKQFCEQLNIQNTNTVVKILQSLINKKLLYKKQSSYLIFSPYFKYWIDLNEK